MNRNQCNERIEHSQSSYVPAPKLQSCNLSTLAWSSEGIYAQRSTLNFSGSSTFGNNSAEDGGGIYARRSTLNFNGSSTFGNNLAEYGGGIYAVDNTLMNFNGNPLQ